MPRPRKNRVVAFSPDVTYFKPRGIPLRSLEEVRLTVDELEAIRLADLLGLSQEEAGGRMGVSRATFGRIIQRARRQVADALISGKAIRVEGGSYHLDTGAATMVCAACSSRWVTVSPDPDGGSCPVCNQRSQMQPNGSGENDNGRDSG